MSLTPLVLRNAVDAHVVAGVPSANYSGGTSILTKSAGAGSQVNGIIYFPRSFPLGATILSATLRLYQVGPESASHTIKLQRLTASWLQSRVNWTNQPASTASGEVSLTKAAAPSGTEWAFNVAAHMQTVSDGAQWTGWKILSLTDGYLSFWSAQSALKPTLEITWLDNPDAPSTLSPSGNRAVSIAKPVLRFDFTDVSGSTSLQAVQVQLNATNVWTAPTFDSGTVVTSAPELDLAQGFARSVTVNTTATSTTVGAATAMFEAADVGHAISAAGIPAGATISAFTSTTQVTISAAATATATGVAATITRTYAGLASGASTYWRVRVQDGAGLWSGWSAGMQYSRQTQGTLALSNPPASGLISEPTPPIIWSLTGRTQAAWQIFVVPSPNTSVILYNTGKVAGPGAAHTLPAGILRDDTSYTVYLRTWDTIAREATPGDPAYAQATQAFTYDYDATVDPVTSLAVTDLAPAPAATLTWSRATAPDSFIIRRNGVIIASGLPPAELSTGGTGYSYTDRTADPNKSITWTVQAVVNAKTSAGSPSVVGILRPIGIWLSDLAGTDVQLLGQESGTWTMGEQGETYAPLGGWRSIRITQALRGLEGNLSGEIMTTPTGTLDEKEAAVYKLKSTPGVVYQLTLSNLSIPVVIANVTVQPQPYKEIVKTVSFDFWQTGDMPFTAVL